MYVSKYFSVKNYFELNDICVLSGLNANGEKPRNHDGNIKH